MAKRRMPPRYKSGPKKGQFMPKSARKRKAARRNPPKKNPPRRRRSSRPAAKRAAPRRRAARRNPPKRDLLGGFMDGAIEAGQILVGKAAARSVPDLLKLPKQGNVGLAIQAGVALAVGFAADMFLGRDAARAMLAGGLTAPMETLIVAYKVPWLGNALAPVTSAEGVGAYVARGAGGRNIVVRRNPGRSVAAATRRGMGSYATNGRGAQLFLN